MNKKTFAYASGLLLIVGGGLFARYIDASAGAALVAAGGFVVGALQKEWLPKAPTLGAVPEEKKP